MGFGYVDKHESVEMPDTDNNDYPSMKYQAPLKSPLKSAMKTPGAPPRDLGNILSPTFKQEQGLERLSVNEWVGETVRYSLQLRFLTVNWYIWAFMIVVPRENSL